MNIQEAKTQIEQSVKIYLMKDAYGNYRIPLEKQRPIFLLGAPGIGKTAIMEQIAQEMDLGLVTYSMTHHTRQSALGLPFIVHKQYGDEEFDVSMYTMSEIIASVYETMEKSGRKEGILFLDEINCVSETLGPSMLQFLQYKTFGNHSVPRGWVIVTAGNPPEFNRSVREFDVVTMDRLKVLTVSADFEVWKHYAIRRGVHKAILTYLSIKNTDFYEIENTVDGRNYVTARGWEDLSEALYLYEECGFPVDDVLVSQYIGNSRISGEFASYYELYNKYRTDYQIPEILEGCAGEMVTKRAQKASFDERVSIMGLLLEALLPQIRESILIEDSLKELLPGLRAVKEQSAQPDAARTESLLAAYAARVTDDMKSADAAHGLAADELFGCQYRIEFLEETRQGIRLASNADNAADFALLQDAFSARVTAMQTEKEQIGNRLRNLFVFAEENFGEGSEMLILVTELTVNEYSAKFIAQNGCDMYYKYNKKFLMYERNKELMDKLNRLMEREEKEEILADEESGCGVRI